MAGGADGLVRGGVPLDPAGGDPHHHPQQPEMLCAARSADEQARQSLYPGRRTPRPRTAARRSSPATSASSARGSPTRSSSTRPILRRKLESGCRSSSRSSSTRSSAPSAERIERIERLAAELAPIVGADVEKARRAARLCKADLLTEVVGEFPELQGLMGKYYAQAQGEDGRSRAPARSTTSRSARTTACRPIRSRSRWRSPTNSTCWSAFGRSMRSQPAARTPTGCEGRRSASNPTYSASNEFELI